MLVVGGVQMAAQLVGGGPELGFKALVAGVFGLLLGWSARHGVPSGSFMSFIARKAKTVRSQAGAGYHPPHGLFVQATMRQEHCLMPGCVAGCDI